MKRFVVAVVVAGVVLIAWYVRRPSAPAVAAASVAPPSAAPPSPARPPRIPPPAHVRRIETPAIRAQVAEQIAAATRRRAASSAGPTETPARPALPETIRGDDVELVRTSIREAMREAVPYLTACYEAALPTLAVPDLTVRAQLTLTGDPDVGTLIDAHQLADDHAQPLPIELDGCLRTAMQALELPPLAEGDVVEVTYPFVFQRH